jgi:TrmH family RNA methyltransferase
LDIIKSKDNSIIKLYNKLSNNRKDRKKLGQFVLEGYRIVVDAFSENAPLTHILVSQEAYEKYSQTFTDMGMDNITLISNELALKVSSTENTQGVFAICEMPKDTALNVKKDGKYIVLYQVQDPGNVGMIVRTADAFGLDGVILSQSCDFYSPKVIRSTMGSAFRVNHYICEDIQEVLETFKNNGITTYSAVIDSPNDVVNESFIGGSAILVGNEGNGLPREVSQKCDKPITIKMSGNINSLNVAMASGIIMWKMSNQSL